MLIRLLRTFQYPVTNGDHFRMEQSPSASFSSSDDGNEDRSSVSNKAGQLNSLVNIPNRKRSRKGLSNDSSVHFSRFYITEKARLTFRNELGKWKTICEFLKYSDNV
ncbi:hypothetical protein NPIL_522581 [Nephila pilipes]|uniref:Uncharacterized protein n=1 Tax=Nephila pilipes TaxID=299642 RepID=A0A8X6QK52_NEPPI|nr:hypothetical protein NPIL_522581 [Nephila pilipes]